MDKYEYKVRADEIKALISQGEFAEAVSIADTIDWRRVKSVMMLCTISDLYKINRRYQESKDILMLAYEKHPTGRLIVYSLCELSIKMEEYVQAIEFYKEFVQIAPKDTGRYILQYRLYEAQDVSLEERIAVLEEFKKRDYREKWAYELAYLYHRIGLATKCVEECDEMFLWFGEGKHVIKALELKALHEPLSEDQRAKYDAWIRERDAGDDPVEEEPSEEEDEIDDVSGDTRVVGRIEDMEAEHSDEQAVPAAPTMELPEVKTVDVGQYNTINLQMALAESMKEILAEDVPQEPSEDEQESDDNAEPTSITESLIAPLLQETMKMPDPEEMEEQMQEAPVIPFPEQPAPEEEQAEEELIESDEDVQDVQAELYEGLEDVQTESDEDIEDVQAEPDEDIEDVLAESDEDIEDMQPESDEDIEDVQPESDEGPEDVQAEPDEGPEDVQAESGEGIEDVQVDDRSDEQSDNLKTMNTDDLQEISSQIAEEDTASFDAQQIVEQMKQEAQQAIAAADTNQMVGATTDALTPLNVRPIQYDNFLSQEYDGQISLVMPETARVEKQITGQLSIDDIMAEWEEMKKTSEQRRMEEVRQRILAQTGNLFADFDEATQNGLLEEMERAYLAVMMEDPDRKPAIKTVILPDDDDTINDASDAVETEVENLAENVLFNEELPEDDAEDEVEELEEIEEIATEESMSTEPVEDIQDTTEQAAEEVFEVSEEESAEEVSEASEEESAEEVSEVFEEESAEEVSEAPEEESAEEVSEAPEEESAEEVSEAPEEESAEEVSEVSEEESADQEEEISEENLQGSMQDRGLTAEEQALFGQFARHNKSKRQLVQTLDNMSLASCTGNVIVTGEEEITTLTLAKALIKEMQYSDNNFSGKVAKISANVLNKKDVAETFARLDNGALIIEKASSLKPVTVSKMTKVLEKDNMGLLIIMIDKKQDINQLLVDHAELNNNFNLRMDIEPLDDEALVAYAKQYAEEMEYSIDEFGILALHTRIADRQTSDHEVSMAEVRELVDEAIYYANKKTPKHFMDILLAKRYDERDMIILREKDFMHY